MKMKFSLASLAIMAGAADAFPAMAIEQLQQLAGRAGVPAESGGSASGVPFPPDPAQLTGTFDAKAQYVSNTGVHKYVAPGPGDVRGPCPGLNAMANHGYLPHTGVATIEEFIQGTYEVFGMSLDLSGFLAVFGAVFDGDLQKWSIGGPTPLVGLGGTGLIGSHNKYENDASPVRPDLYEYGNNYEINWDQWKELYALQADKSAEDANYNLGVLQKFRSTRFDQSVDNNPYFFNGPFSGVLVQPAAYTFIYRFMANKSAEHPDGVLNKNVLKAFYGVTEHEDGSFSGGLGHEYIPDNWYKRAIGDEYSIPFFLEDVLYEISVYPKFADIGGNTGKTNSFTIVNVTDLSGGLFNAANLLQGNNLFCFAYLSAMNGIPDAVQNVLGSLDGLLRTVAPQAADAIASLGCPQIANFDQSYLSQFPGYTRGEDAI